MKRLWVIWPATALALLAQAIDFSVLDKLAGKAKESAVVNLGPEQLSLVAGLGGKGGAEKLGDLAKELRAVQVRSFEYDAPGMYDMELVRSFRDKVKASGEWTSVVSVKEKDGFTEILVKKGTQGKPGGLLIVAAEPKEVSVVHVEGLFDLSALRGLGVLPGVPSLGAGPKKEAAPSPAPKSGKQE